MSAGVLTTLQHERRASVFDKMNPVKHNILPSKLYQGKKPDNDKFIRRIVKQLDDIEFSEDEVEPEAIVNLRRQKNTVLTEENLKKYLNSETLGINLENHYWVSNSFISKITVLAPNL